MSTKTCVTGKNLVLHKALSYSKTYQLAGNTTITRVVVVTPPIVRGEFRCHLTALLLLVNLVLRFNTSDGVCFIIHVNLMRSSVWLGLFYPANVRLTCANWTELKSPSEQRELRHMISLLP